MPIPYWTILADDLTGACDTGVVFTRRGWAARVAFTPEAGFGSAPVRVVTTESRALAEDAAVRAVERAVQALGLSDTSRVYKKIDSTLRGHPGAELAALMRALEGKRALVTPAFPGQGRIVRVGRVYVRGVLLEETEFGREVAQPDMLRLFAPAGECRSIPLNTIRDGVERLAEVLGAGARTLSVRPHPAEGERPVVYVADAETGEDLRILARAAQSAGIRLLCGSAGLARALILDTPAPAGASALADTSAKQGEALPVLPSQDGPVLAVAGSYSPVTRRQVEAARAVGITVICPPYTELRIDNIGEEANSDSLPGAAREAFSAEVSDFGMDEEETDRAETETVEQGITHHLAIGKDVILCSADLPRFPGAEQEIAARLAALAAGALGQARVGGLVLTGGDTAAAVCRALGSAAIDLGGEVQPGVVWGRLADGRFAGLPVVTKAGGFGETNTLVEAIRFLENKRMGHG